MDFLKTGFDPTSIHDPSLDDDSVKMLTALMTLFVEDAMKTAIIYTNTRSRKEITARDMRKSLMYQAQTFFSQDESLEERYIKMIESMNDEDEEDSGEEDSGEEDSGEEDCDEYETREHDEESGEENADDETCVCDETIIDTDLANRMDEMESAWNTWNPTDPVLCLLKRSINKIEPDALTDDERC
jgi:cobalamin biosynthesis protein CobT